MRFTQAQVDAYNSRRKPADLTPIEALDLEADLHEQIFAECRRRRWIALHGAMSERTHRTLGEWDFTIVADGRRTFFVECKSKSGKVRPEQQALIHAARALGHQVHVVRSLAEFLDVVKDAKP